MYYLDPKLGKLPILCAVTVENQYIKVRKRLIPQQFLPKVAFVFLLNYALKNWRKILFSWENAF